jgi:anti-sigma factor RsiW
VTIARCLEVTERFDAYLDGELEPDRAAAVRDHAGACTNCRQQLADREWLMKRIRRAPYYTAPNALRLRLARSHVAAQRMSRRFAWAVAAVLAVSIGAGVSIRRWPGRPPSALVSESVAQAVVDSHVRALMADHLLDVPSTDQHTVKPWFLGKLDFAPPVADLTASGFPLVGGRLDYIAGRTVAAVVYTHAKHTINLFVLPEIPSSSGSFGARTIRGFHVRHWTNGEMSFWAVSDLNDADLDAFARALQR